MAKVIVFRYDSETDRNRRQNGTQIGVAETFSDFFKLLVGNRYFGYQNAENNDPLNYNEVEDLFGVPRGTGWDDIFHDKR